MITVVFGVGEAGNSVLQSTAEFLLSNGGAMSVLVICRCL